MATPQPRVPATTPIGRTGRQDSQAGGVRLTNARTPPALASRTAASRAAAGMALVPAATLLLAALASCGGVAPLRPRLRRRRRPRPPSHRQRALPSSSSSTLQLSVYFLSDGKIAADHRTVPQTTDGRDGSREPAPQRPLGRRGRTGLRAPCRRERASRHPSRRRHRPDPLGPGVPGSARLTPGGARRRWTTDLHGDPVPDGDRRRVLERRRPDRHRRGQRHRLRQARDAGHFEALAPAIFIESPCIGDSVGSPLSSRAQQTPSRPPSRSS